MSNHTPGPWQTFPPNDPTEVKAIHGSPGMEVCDLIPVIRLGPGYKRIANAHLIAAAPEMYEALKKVKDHIKTIFPDSFEMSGVWTLVDSALTKAEGG